MKKTIFNLLTILTVLTLLSGCNSKVKEKDEISVVTQEKTEKERALELLSSYSVAESESEVQAPTIETYISAGFVNVTLDNLNAINEGLRNLDDNHNKADTIESSVTSIINSITSDTQDVAVDNGKDDSTNDSGNSDTKDDSTDDNGNSDTEDDSTDDSGNSDTEEDPFFSRQWNLHSIPKEYNKFITEDDLKNHLDVPSTWNLGVTGEGVKVAVIEINGFDTEHPEYKDSIVATYNAETGEKDVSTGINKTGNSHGTQVAGIIAAKKDGAGMIGVAPDVSLILISLTNPNNNDNRVSFNSIVNAFNFAADNGAKVINCSWGAHINISEQFSDLLRVINEKGVTIVFSAGNKSINYTEDQTNTENQQDYVIGVGASDEMGNRASYSNYGGKLDILAPAGLGGIITTDELGSFGLNPGKASISQEDLEDEDYAYFAGTSAAAPEVSGLIALMISAHESNGETSALSPHEIRLLLINSATKIGDLSQYSERGYSVESLYGLANANKPVVKIIEAAKIKAEQLKLMKKDANNAIKSILAAKAADPDFDSKRVSSNHSSTAEDGDYTYTQFDTDKEKMVVFSLSGYNSIVFNNGYGRTCENGDRSFFISIRSDKFDPTKEVRYKSCTDSEPVVNTLPTATLS